MRPMNSKARRVENLAMKFTNQRRADRGLARVDTDGALVSAAREHSRDMAKREYLAHVSDRHGGPDRRVRKYDTVFENCARIYGWNRSAGKIAGSAVDDWMTSGAHRAAILNDSVARTGVGVWRNGNDVYFTQMFVPPATFPKIDGFIQTVKRAMPTL